MNKDPIEIFRSAGGQLRMVDAINHGISRYMLYSLRDKKVIEQISRGIYRLADLPPIDNPDFVTVSLRYPQAVMCLITALAYHEITTQIPHHVSIAVPRNSRLPSLGYPPLEVHAFSKHQYEAGIVEHRIDGVKVKIYSPEKTIADCFKYRNKIGIDVTTEALKLYRSRKKFDLNALFKYAKICRVENVMRPYLEMLL
ncbi:MAG: type IV toxin-antitoxin system AbiEi family antitoxin domain-containing protein [Acidobacteriota bacterium]